MRSIFANKTIVCLDLGTNTGWAVRRAKQDKDTGLIANEFYSGVENFVKKTHEGAGMRYLMFHDWLTSNFELDDVVLFYEQVTFRHSSIASSHVYGGFQSHLQTWCERNKIPYKGVPVSTIKKAATGSGRASKKIIMASVSQLFEKYIDDDNEADALALLNYVLITHNLKNSLPAGTTL